MGTIVVGFAKYDGCCEFNFVDKRHTTKSTKFITLKNFFYTLFCKHIYIYIYIYIIYIYI